MVFFDFAVINALGPDHWMDTAGASGRAAELYGQHKRQRLRTEERCRERGLRFWLLVREQQGGMCIDAYVILRAAATAVADRNIKSEGRPQGVARPNSCDHRTLHVGDDKPGEATLCLGSTCVVDDCWGD